MAQLRTALFHRQPDERIGKRLKYLTWDAYGPSNGLYGESEALVKPLRAASQYVRGHGAEGNSTLPDSVDDRPTGLDRVRREGGVIFERLGKLAGILLGCTAGETISAERKPVDNYERLSPKWRGAFVEGRKGLYSMLDLSKLEVWFVVGSQSLYGEQTLEKVREHAQEMTHLLSQSPEIPAKIVLKSVLTSPEAITSLCLEAASDNQCVGLLIWMHTFSPARMWIGGLKSLRKPFAHLHTQYNRTLPWSTIDMDFMNLNQSAHGDREFGFIGTRLGLNRKVIVGFWKDDDVIAAIATWARAAAAWHEAQRLKIARFGDNMRDVAVTEGDKLEAQIRLGYSVEGYGVGDLSCLVKRITEAEIDKLAAEYDEAYEVAGPLRPGGERRQSLREAARIELGLRAFLEDGGFNAFTDTFEDLHGLGQLPGIAVQRLMAAGYGFGAEGDWKTAALVRLMKVMGAGLPGGTSFMEDYTYDFAPPPKVLGAHMLEVCPSIADGKPSLEVHPLSIGGKGDPVRLVFNACSGPAVNVCLIDVGKRFRLIVNEVDVVPPDEALPRLPVARAVWIPRPNLKIAAAAWIYAGGSHHTGFSQALKTVHLADFAEMSNIELLRIDSNTGLEEFRKELRWNDGYRFLNTR